MSVLDQIITKISDVNLSDLNYELGKAKENIVCESGNYLGNLKTDASLVSNIIKTESNRLNNTYFDGKLKIPNMQKSLSLPQFNFGVPNIQEYNSFRVDSSGSSCSETDLETNTRSLASKVSFPTVEQTNSAYESDEEECIPRKDGSHMQMCFIDDVDDDIEDELFPPIGGDFKFFCDDEHEEEKPKTVKQLMLNAKDSKIKNLQTKARRSLAKCKEKALQDAEIDKKKLFNENPVFKLLGVQKDNWEVLEEYESEVLKDVIKQLKVKISEYNGELVKLIEEKDNLELKREEIIVDIKDLSSIL